MKTFYIQITTNPKKPETRKVQCQDEKTLHKVLGKKLQKNQYKILWSV